MIITDAVKKLTTPVQKDKRELIADITFTLIGIVVAVLSIQKGGWMVVPGVAIIAMLVILFFMPEKAGF